MIAALGLLTPALALQFATSAPAQKDAPAAATESGAGQICFPRDGRMVPMPLERTSVRAEIAGVGARVTLVQTFVNPSPTPIEAVYTFPMPDGAAVDRMRIRVGSRVVEGEIRRRDEARREYERARAQGQAAALLDKETGDVFTQSVANVRPGESIEVEISYVELLRFEGGEFEFAFPMVVGPRYLGATTKEPGKLNPPRVAPTRRSGQNVDLSLTVRGGAPITEFRSVLHEVTTNRRDGSTLEVSLAKRDEIPNRDFVFRYRTTQAEVRESLLTHWDERTGGHFALVLAPPAQVAPRRRAPKEIVFVVDQSGSQQGFPIEKSKELTRKLMATLASGDRFNVVGFSEETNPLWPGPRSVTPENLSAAREFVDRLEARGGTALERAVVAALSPPTDPGRVRVVLFNTDGLAGQESTILENVRRYRGGSRLFTFGIGNSVNRGLISAMSREGRGADEVVTLSSDADEAVARLTKRLETPLLVDPAARFEGGGVEGVVPSAMPDVFSTKPVVLYGRYTRPGRTRLVLTGRTAEGPWRREIDVDLPRGEGDGSSIASLWGRAKIADLASEAYAEHEISGAGGDPTEEITRLALAYRLVTPTTSFVAVDRSAATGQAPITTISVPVETPDGMAESAGSPTALVAPATAAPRNAGGFGGGFGGGGLGRAAPSGGFSSNAKASNHALDDREKTSEFLLFDATDLSPIDRDGRTPRRAGAPTVEIQRGLLDARGRVDLRIWVKGPITPEMLRKLGAAGLEVGGHDGATLVFATGDARAVRAAARLGFVVRLARLRAAE